MDDMCSGILADFTENALEVFEQVSTEEVEQAVGRILKAKKVFVLGIGQTGCIGRILTMKLCHVGLNAYTVFDEINPPLEQGDLFIAISQSGETKTIVGLAEKAKDMGGRVLAVTAHTGSPLSRIADTVLRIGARGSSRELPHLSAIGEGKHQNLSGTLFGKNIYMLFYTLAVMAAGKRKESPETIDRRHANLQ